MKLKYLCVAFVALFSTFSTAQAAVYVYDGNPFTNFQGSYACPPHCEIDVTFTVASAFAPNLAYGNQGVPISYSITDGFTTLTNLNSFLNLFNFATDGTGAITKWDFEASQTPGGNPILFTFFTGPGNAGDQSLLNGNPDRAFNQNLPGVWTVSAVPEPATWAMMLVGFAGIGFLAYRRSKRLAAA